MRSRTYRPGRALKPFRHPWLWFTLWVALMAAVLVLSLLPGSAQPARLPGSDKLVHGLAYAVLMGAAVQLYARRASWWVVALLLAAIGLAIEFLQGAMGLGRVAEAGDMGANLLGIGLGLASGFTPLRDALLWLDGGTRPGKPPPRH